MVHFAFDYDFDEKILNVLVGNRTLPVMVPICNEDEIGLISTCIECPDIEIYDNEDEFIETNHTELIVYSVNVLFNYLHLEIPSSLIIKDGFITLLVDNFNQIKTIINLINNYSFDVDFEELLDPDVYYIEDHRDMNEHHEEYTVEEDIEGFEYQIDNQGFSLISHYNAPSTFNEISSDRILSILVNYFIDEFEYEVISNEEYRAFKFIFKDENIDISEITSKIEEITSTFEVVKYRLV